MPSSPLISIITPSFNRADYIEQAIHSVLTQNYPGVEHIVIDGGSTDRTLRLLEKFPRLITISEPDQGMYDALNKGLRLAKGEIIGFLNTDDSYTPNIFQDIADRFTAANIDAVAGKARIFCETPDQGRKVLLELSPSSPDRFLEQMVLGIPAFNAWFFRKSVFQKNGGFDADYRIIADREFMIRLALSGIVYSTLDRLVYEYCQHEGSLTMSGNEANQTKIISEHLKLTEHYLRKVGTPRIAKQYLREMRTYDTLTMSILSIRRRQAGKVLFYAWQGIKHDWTWLQKFCLRIFRHLLRPTKKEEQNA